MGKDRIKVILAGNFYDESKVRKICRRVGAVEDIVAFSVDGKPGITNYFKLVDHWIKSLLRAYKRAGVIQ